MSFLFLLIHCLVKKVKLIFNGSERLKTKGICFCPLNVSHVIIIDTVMLQVNFFVSYRIQEKIIYLTYNSSKGSLHTNINISCEKFTDRP